MSPWHQRNGLWNTVSVSYDRNFFVALRFLINIVIFVHILLFSLQKCSLFNEYTSMVTFVTSTLVDRYLFLNIVLVMIQEIGLIYIVKNIEQFNHFKIRIFNKCIPFK